MSVRLLTGIALRRTVAKLEGKVTPKDAQLVVRAFLEAVGVIALSGANVHLPGFGVFYRSTSKPKKVPTRQEPTRSTYRLGFRASKFQKGQEP